MANPWERDWSGATEKSNKKPWEQEWTGELTGQAAEEGTSVADVIRNYGLALPSGAGAGIAATEAGIGTFIQAPAANTLSGVLGARAIADRGVTSILNSISPGSAQLNPEYQQAAQQASQFAAEQRAQPGILNTIGGALQDDGRQRGQSIQAFDAEFNPELIRQQQAQAKAEGFVENLAAIKDNPLAFAHTLARSAPDMVAGAGVAKGVAAGLAAAGKTTAAQVAGASTAGMLAESASSAYQAREGVYQQVVSMPVQKLSASPRFNEILTQEKDPVRAREILANELADQAPMLTAAGTGAGTLLTNKLFKGDTTAEMLAGKRIGAKEVIKNTGQEGVEEGLQGTPEDIVQHGAMVQADPTHKYDFGGSLAQNMAAGHAMGGGGSAAAYATQSYKDFKANGGQDAPGAPPGTTAGDVLGTPEQGGGQSAPTLAAPTEAEKALYTPKNLTALDRVAEIDSETEKLKARREELNNPSYGVSFQEERDDVGGRIFALGMERSQITEAWPKASPGAATSFTTEAGARLDGQYALIEAGDLTTSHDESLRPTATYPTELQPRERERHASEMQIQQIVQRLDPARLGESADVANGAPIVGADGLVESGNARTIALKRVYQANGQKAIDYKDFLKANAARFGITPESVDAMQKPVLVRVRSTPVNRAEFARQANQSTVARMSPSEQARSDAAQIDSLDDLNPNEAGDFMSGSSSPFVRRFMAKLPATEQAGLIDATGQLSQAGYQRIRNAVLAKAYGDSPVLQRMVESLDSNIRNVGAALMRVAPQIAKAREAIGEGALYDVDLTPDLMAAVEELSTLKEKGTSVAEALAQAGMFGDKLTPEARELLSFLDANIRSPRRIAEFIQSYINALTAAGNPAQGSMFGETAVPTKVDLIAAARRLANGEPTTTTGGTAAGDTTAAAEGGQQPANSQGNQAGAGSNEAGSEWLNFPPDTGSLGIPRAEMPQIKGEHRGALIQFLQGRGITHETVELPANQLKPTQAEFSVKKVEGWAARRDDVDRSVLASSDGYILDGHHQWVAALAAGETEKVIRFNVPIQELLAAVREFPSVKKSEGAKPRPAGELRREIIDQQWNDALADLGAIIRDYVPMSRMLPEDTPNLMPTLVKLFEAGFGKVGMKIGDLMKYVKAELKKIPEFKTVWNKIDDPIYRKAAAQALGNHQAAPQGDLFGPMVAKAQAAQADLFSAPAPKVGAEKVAASKITIDQQEYDLDAPNFGMPKPPITLKAGDPLLIETDKKPADSVVSFRGEEMTRAQMRQILEESYFRNAVPAPDGRKPIAYVMGGGGASGKGTIKKYLRKEGVIQSAEAVDIDPDELKLDIPEFNAIKDAGDSRGAAIVHEESSAMAKRIKERAMAGRYDIILDVTLGDPKKGEKYLQDLKSAGYEVRLYGVSVQPESAVIRAMKRAAHSWRYVPINHLLSAHKGFVSSFSRYAEIADEARLYENTTDHHNVAEKNNGILEIKDHKAYTEIVERSQINESAETLREIRGPRQGAGRNNGENGRQEGTSSRQDANGDHRGRNDGDQVVAQGVGSGSQPEKSGSLVNDPDGKDGASSTEGQGAGPASATSGSGNTAGVPGGPGRGNQRPDINAGDETGNQAGGVQDSGATAGRKGGNTQHGGQNGNGNRPVRNAAVPVGRDIPAKSGLNYAFGDGDLTYAGGWLKKATQNVEAVELLKKLQAEKRQATRDEQAVLAKFIGWGASEIANTIFGPKLDKQLEAIQNYERALGYLEKSPYGLRQRELGFYQAFQVLADKSPDKYSQRTYYEIDRITKDMLESARPDMSVSKWADLRDRLKAVLTKEEWEAASRSTQNAHYTSKPVVQSIMAAVSAMGFKGGTILEPGAGIGVFPGLMPPEMASNSIYTGIEMEPITGGILKQLMPDERILVESFIDSKLPENFYDVAFGNPPFAAFKVLADPKYAKLALPLHDYFFAKTIDSVKPGGLVVFVTSRFTMDKKGDKARSYMAERADLVGAIRLPQTAFQKNAGTEVVTDVLFLRKKVPGETFAQAQSWAGLADVKTEKGSVPINEYYAAHPEMVLGTHSQKGSMYGKDEYTVLPKEGDIEAHFAAAVANLPANVFVAGRGSAAEAAKVRDMDFNPTAKKEGSFYVSGAGVLMQREGGVGARADEKHQKNAEVLKDYVALRDAVKQTQFDQLNDGDWEASLKALQQAYSAFKSKHGQLLQNTTYMQRIKVDELDEDGTPTGNKVDDEEQRRRFPMRAILRNDPEYTLVESLENINEDTGEVTESKWLTERTLGKPTAAEVKTPADALLAVLNDTGSIDIAAVADRIGLSEQETIDSLGTLIYEDPAQGWVMADEYLSGNVKKKLAQAEEAAKSDKAYARNVEALKEVQPAPRSPEQITPQIGMNWIPGEVYEEFLRDVTGVRAKIEYVKRTREWVVQTLGGEGTPQATSDWGVGDKAHAGWLMDKALSGAAISLNKSVSDGKGGSKQVFDPDRTEAANEKRAALRAKFREWLFQDAQRTTDLVQLYNDKFNTNVQRKFDGKHLTLPGTSKLFKIFDHVKRGAWRVIQTGNTYLAHAVGSGKTFEMVISAMEQKRLGLIKKPMIIVPGHMLQQFASEWQQLYPTARLMVADETDFHTDNRRRFVSRVAMSDLDGVIMTHSSFGLLDLDPAFKQKMLEQELDVLRASYEEAGGDLGDIGDKKVRKEPKIKRIEAQIEKLEQQLAKAMSSEGKDKNVRFDEMGVDFLYVDEAHLFRKLSFATARDTKGIDPNGSQMAWDLYMKTRWLAEKNPTRNLVLASGTAITNTTAELYTVQRYMAPQVLEENGLAGFDDWAAQFGEESTTIESTASGKYEPVTRFQNFVNVGEMTQMFRDFADVLNEDHLAALLGDARPKVKGGARKSVITPKTAAYVEFLKETLAPRIEASRKWKPTFEEKYNPDPIIAINIDARLAAIDMRFMDPKLPNDPDSKLNQMIDGVIRVYKENENNEYREKSKEKDKDGNPIPGPVEAIKGATQMVFFESGFGRMVAQRRGFNARAWMEKRLRDAGIPSEQLAFMEDYKKSASKLKLFADVNKGKVRVLVGSSAAMGTGVNAQQRLVALHHLDAPYVPATLEQREGRIVRQGNKNPEVQIYAYSMFGSFDENMWSMLARKKFFIEQAMSGDPNIRSIEDVGEVNQLQMAAGLVAENPFVLQHAGAKAEVEKLTRLYRNHEEQRARHRTDYENAGRTIDYNEQWLPDAEKEAAKVKDLHGDAFTAKVGSQAFDKRKEWGEAVLAKAKDLSDALSESRTKVGEISGFDVMFTGGMTAGQYVSRLDLQLPIPVALAHGGVADPSGMATRAVNALVDLQRKPDAMRKIIAEAKAKRQALESRLEAPFPLAEQLANKIKETADLEQKMLSYGTEPAPRLFNADEWANSTTPMFSRSNDPLDGGTTVESVKKASNELLKGLKRIPKLIVVWKPSELSDYGIDAPSGVRGVYFQGNIFVVAGAIRTKEELRNVIAHELMGHFGLRGFFGIALDEVLFRIHNANPKVKAAADAWLKSNADWSESLKAEGATDDQIKSIAIEEALAEIAQKGDKISGWKLLTAALQQLMRRVGLNELADKLEAKTDAEALAALKAAELFVKIGIHAGSYPIRSIFPMWQRTLADDLAEQEKWLAHEAKMRGFKSIDDLAEKAYPVFEKLAAMWRKKHPVEVALMSRAVSPAPTAPAKTANDIINTPSATARPLDNLVKGAVTMTGLPKLTTALYNKAAFFLDRFTPETIKAGMVSDYGIPEAVLDQRAVMQGRQRQQIRTSGALLEKLATLTRAESRVAYEWMNTDDPQSSDYFLNQLPPESIKTLAEVEKMIDDLSKEAVRLGQLDPEAFKRNRFAYLHRSYVKHTAELTKGEAAGRQRAIAILGDQYKGRGMSDAASMAKIKNIAPEWWKRKLQAGKADSSLKGEKFIRLERRAPIGAGTTPLPGMTGPTPKKHRLLEVAYWPADTAIPPMYAGWDQAGTWLVRDTKGDKVIVWRDFTKQERESMGEIDEVRYAIAKTLHNMIHDTETGRYLEWLAQRYAKKEGETIPGEVVEASNSMLTTFKPGQWVQVPDTKVPGTQVKKYGTLAGRYLPGPIWNDVRQTVGFRFKPLGDTYAAIHRAWKTSKALALDTPIPTPNGWTTMGEIRVGDEVFDETGRICLVMGATEVQHDRKCYEVAFSDGTKIVADAEHRWFTIKQGHAGVRTTDEIRATLKERTRGDANHKIPVAAALDLPDADLPIPPYALGAWLGDGDTSTARLSVGGDDLDEMLENLRQSGVRCGRPRKDKRNNVYTVQLKRGHDGCCRGHAKSEQGEKGCRICNNERRRMKTAGVPYAPVTNQHIQVVMRDIGLLGNKHIPAEYLRASEDQRRTLLHGLMDTDGHVDKRGMCAFTTTLPALRDGVIELVRSLGYKPTLRSFEPECNGKKGKTAWVISFKSYSDKPAFSLSRKKARLHGLPARQQRSQTRQIVSITPIKSVPVRCIAVSSKSRLYLAGVGMVPTHNTALSPAVHMNNVMANFVMADWHDVTAGHIAKALKLMVSKDPAAAEVLARFGDSGGTIGTWATKELQDEQLRPLLEELEKELGIAGNVTGQVGIMSALQLALQRKFPEAFDALKGSMPGKGAKWAGGKMIDLYEAEDQVFRLASWLRAKEEGATDLQAGKVARKSFLDYSINAPWVQMMRSTALPFVAFTYRAVPMMMETAAKKPWKLLKLGLVAGAATAFGTWMAGGDDDDERKLLPEEKSGLLLGFRTDLFGTLDNPIDIGVAPKLIRMPWNSESTYAGIVGLDGTRRDGSPVFLDVRRWVPVGDVFDTGATHAALPILPSMQPGGPLILFGELALNKQGFTGKAITLETDTPVEKAQKLTDYMYKAFAPNVAVLPGTYAWTAIANAGSGKTDSFGRELSLPQSIISSVGIKVGSYPKDVLQLNAVREAQFKTMEIDRNITGLKREFQKSGLTEDEFQEKVAAQIAKKVGVSEALQKRMQ